MKIWKRATTVILAAALLLVAGCSGADTSWAYRTQDSQLPVGVYIYYMISSVNEVQSKVLEQHADDEDYTLPEKYKDLLSETVDGQSASDYLAAAAKEKIQKHIAVERKFDELGLELQDSQIQYATNTAETNWEAADAYEKSGVAASSIALAYENSIKEQMIYMNIYGEGGEREVPRTDLEATLAENYAAADVMAFAKDLDDDGEVQNTAKAEGYLNRAKNGEDLYALMFEQEMEEAMESAAEGEDVEITQPEPDSRLVIFTESMRASYGDQLIDDAFSAQVGEPLLSEDDYYFYILLRRDILEDPDFVDVYFDELLDTLKGEEFDELLAEWGSAVELEANDAAISKHTASKLALS